jgi:hypothetical protein
MVAIEKMELVSLSGDGEKMQFSSSCAKTDLRHKVFERLYWNKK